MRVERDELRARCVAQRELDERVLARVVEILLVIHLAGVLISLVPDWGPGGFFGRVTAPPTALLAVARGLLFPVDLGAVWRILGGTVLVLLCGALWCG